MTRLATLALALSLLVPASTTAFSQPATPSPSDASGGPTDLRIARAGSQPSMRGPAEFFTGSVRVDPLFPAEAPSRMSGALVTFEPSARSAWHTHPVGQVLVVTTGLGWVQREGGPVEVMRPGDVVLIPPGLRHWHGAAATTGVTHMALQEQVDGQAVTWMEKVSDAQYRP